MCNDRGTRTRRVIHRRVKHSSGAAPPGTPHAHTIIKCFAFSVPAFPK